MTEHKTYPEPEESHFKVEEPIVSYNHRGMQSQVDYDIDLERAITADELINRLRPQVGGQAVLGRQ